MTCVVVPLVRLLFRLSEAAKTGGQMIDTPVARIPTKKYGRNRSISAIFKFIKPMAVAALALYRLVLNKPYPVVQGYHGMALLASHIFMGLP